MKTPSLIVLFLIVFFAFSQKISFNTITYKGSFLSGEKPIIKKFFIDVPSGGRIKNKKYQTGDYHTEYRIFYLDSSIIYITNDEWNGSNLNARNRMSINLDGYTKKNLFDTLYNGGKQANSLFWQENILGDIVVGYVNCQPEKKILYDRALKTIRIKKISE